MDRDLSYIGKWTLWGGFLLPFSQMGSLLWHVQDSDSTSLLWVRALKYFGTVPSPCWLLTPFPSNYSRAEHSKAIKMSGRKLLLMTRGSCFIWIIVYDGKRRKTIVSKLVHRMHGKQAVFLARRAVKWYLCGAPPPRDEIRTGLKSNQSMWVEKTTRSINWLACRALSVPYRRSLERSRESHGNALDWHIFQFMPESNNLLLTESYIHSIFPPKKHLNASTSAVKPKQRSVCSSTMAYFVVYVEIHWA